jgi:collagenase-like PrtC family protease
MIWDLYRAGVDALIVQDMGLLELNLPPIPLHASTQMDNRTPQKVRFLAEAGFRQVVLARELSLVEIGNIHPIVSWSRATFTHTESTLSAACIINSATTSRSPLKTGSTSTNGISTVINSCNTALQIFSRS